MGSKVSFLTCVIEKDIARRPMTSHVLISLSLNELLVPFKQDVDHWLQPVVVQLFDQHCKPLFDRQSVDQGNLEILFRLDRFANEPIHVVVLLKRHPRLQHLSLD